MNSVNSVEEERLDVNTFDVTSMFENFEKEEKQNNVNINNNNQTKKNAVVESPRNKSPKKKTTTNHRKVDTQADEDDDDSLENDNSESDNVELKSKSSECCDACHEDFYKERQCISFTYENIDYCVCSVCFKANLKKKGKHFGTFKMYEKESKSHLQEQHSLWKENINSRRIRFLSRRDRSNDNWNSISPMHILYG